MAPRSRRRCAARFGLLPFVCLCAVAGGAGAAEFLPARFGTGEQSIARFLRCPEKAFEAPGQVAVFCQADVREDGALGWPFCIREGVDPVFHRAVMKALRRARFLPAMVDGAPARVMMNFSVIFESTQEECLIYSVPNHGHYGDEFGIVYFAPQVILEHGTGYEQWTRRRQQRGGALGTTIVLNTGVHYALSVRVDESGMPTDGKIERVNANRDWARSSLHALEASRFVPGFVDDAPYPMRFYEFLYAW